MLFVLQRLNTHKEQSNLLRHIFKRPHTQTENGGWYTLYLYKNIPYPLFAENLLFLFECVEMFAEWCSVNQVHDDVQFVTFYRELGR